MRGNHPAAADAALAAWRPSGAGEAGLPAAAPPAAQPQPLASAPMELAVEGASPEFILRTSALRKEWQASSVAALLAHLGTAAGGTRRRG
jgi:hypothetical protein